MGDAVVRALKWLQTAEPLDIIKILPESQTALDRSLFLAAFQRVRECYSPDGSFAPEATQTAWQVAATLGLAANSEPQALLDRSFTNEFVNHGRLRPKG
jgi:NitT/TauT family transport system substrate-binding protein